MPRRDARTCPRGSPRGRCEKSDAHAVFVLMAAQEQEDIGDVAIEEADIVSDWARPSHDLGARSVGVFDGDTLVAYAELMGADRADTSVLPSHRGRGIGTWLAHWLHDLGRRVGSTVVGMPVPQGSPGDRLLEELGFRVRWTSWVLTLPEGATIPERDAAGGLRRPHRGARRAARRARRPGGRLPRVVGARPGDVRGLRGRDQRAGPGSSRGTCGSPSTRTATVVGVSLVLVSDDGSTGYVDRLAVRRDQRNRGLAQALLVDSFARGPRARHAHLRAEHRLTHRSTPRSTSAWAWWWTSLGQSWDRPRLSHGKRMASWLQTTDSVKMTLV